MRPFTYLLLIPFVLLACSKQNENPSGSGGNNNSSGTPPPPSKPTTRVSILVDDSPMVITSLAYQRGSAQLSITATNATQKVTADVYNFYQTSAWNMMYTMEVSYFTRPDSLSGWGTGYTRPAPRDDEVRFVNFTPLKDSLVTGDFSGSFAPAIVTKLDGPVTIKGSFQLVFPH